MKFKFVIVQENVVEVPIVDGLKVFLFFFTLDGFGIMISRNLLFLSLNSDVILRRSVPCRR